MSKSKNDIQGFVRELIPAISAFKTWVVLQLAEDNQTLVTTGSAKTLRVMHSLGKFSSLMQRYEPYLAMFPGEHLADASVAIWFAALSAIAHGLPQDNDNLQKAIRALNAILERERSSLSATDLYIRWNTAPLWFLGTDAEKKIIGDARSALEKAKSALKSAVMEKAPNTQRALAHRALVEISEADTKLQAGLKAERIDRFLFAFKQEQSQARSALLLLPIFGSKSQEKKQGESKRSAAILSFSLSNSEVSLLNLPEVLTLRYLAGQRSEDLVSELLAVLGLRTLGELEQVLGSQNFRAQSLSKALRS